MKNKINLEKVYEIAERLENIEINSIEELDLELTTIVEHVFQIPLKVLEKSNSIYYAFYYFFDLQLKNEKYQALIVNKLVAIVDDKGTTLEVKEHIVQVFMEQSYNKIIEQKLFEYIDRKDELLLELIFDYKVVDPIPSITKTNKFKGAIVDYMNGARYEQNFAKEKLFYRIPTQYFCAFDYRYFDETVSEQIPKKKLYKAILEDRLNSIRLIKNNSIKSDIVRYYCKYIVGKSYQKKFKEIVHSERLLEQVN